MSQLQLHEVGKVDHCFQRISLFNFRQRNLQV
jgi:hypothetical protein